jgi:drug/metabolite transporter (DMT)-like permease
MLIASMLFAVMAVMVKLIGNKIPSTELVFFRNIIGLAIILVSLTHKPLSNSGGKLFLLIFRGLVGTMALLLFFYNTATISLSEATIYVQTAPIFIAIFSFLFLKENIKGTSWFAIVIGFLGIYLILNPENNRISFESTSGLFNGVFTALAYTSIRGLSNHYEPRTVVFSFLISGTILPLLFTVIPNEYTNHFLFMTGKWVFPNFLQWFYIFIIAFTAYFGQIYVTKAYNTGKAGIVGVAGYSNVVFSIPLGMILGDQFPKFYTIVGIFLIFFSGLFVSFDKEK